jgi:hypothetical protein
MADASECLANSHMEDEAEKLALYCEKFYPERIQFWIRSEKKEKQISFIVGCRRAECHREKSYHAEINRFLTNNWRCDDPSAKGTEMKSKWNRS